ncbi:MAG: hypothetical protein ACQEXQ_21385 [Bacillota bacterium]
MICGEWCVVNDECAAWMTDDGCSVDAGWWMMDAALTPDGGWWMVDDAAWMVNGELKVASVKQSKLCLLF